MKRRMSHGGGWAAVRYTFATARKVGFLKLWHAMNSKNACKTCALGMGGQLGGMRNETGSWPEVCKKSLQAMASDMQAGLTPEFFERYSLEQLKVFTPRELETAGRLVSPLIARPGETHYRPISWEEALSRVADRLKSLTPDEAFFYFSGRSSNEAGFLLQLLARIYGTNNVNNCSYYCHQASGVGLSQALGTGTATVVLEDLDECDFFVLIGGNPASNHPRLMTTLKNLRRRGGEVVVINPVKETGLVNFRVPSDPVSLLWGTPIASLYIQPTIGGDLALLAGLAKALFEAGSVDRDFVSRFTDGHEEFAAGIRELTWGEIVASAGIPQATMEELAERYSRAKHAVFAWTMGITHHEHGVENVRMIANVALLRGMVGRRAAGLLPIRGHSNVQGIGSMGVSPQLKEALFERLQNHFGVKLPTSAGLDTLACIDAANAGKLKMGICLGGNLFGSNPDANFTTKAMGKLDQIVYLSTTLNTGHAWGLAKETIILPVLARDEEPQPTTQESMFNFVRISDGGPPRHEGPYSEIAVIASLGEKLFPADSPVRWKQMREHQSIREAIAAIVPGYEKLKEIDRDKKEFQIPGRTFHEPIFKTTTGKASFWVPKIPESKRRPDQLMLMTVRSEGQFNTVVYEDYDLYRNQDRRDVILMNRIDMDRLGLLEDQLVTVHGPAGSLPRIRAREYDIHAGNALMYYPEANVLVPKVIDPQSKTPAFKAVLVTLEPTPIGEVVNSSLPRLVSIKTD